MKSIRFAHVSDTHLCKSYEHSNMREVFERAKNPADSLRECLTRLEEQKLDFVLFTGDLVHEGIKEDYDYFLETVKECMPNTKAVFALGNHDRKQAFCESMGIETRKTYCHVEKIEGLRIVVLDSGVPGEEAGAIGKEQEKWMEKVLKEEKTEYGTILALHHPFVWGNPMFAMGVSDNLQRILQESDVRAIFCGHTHENSVDFLGRIPQITADSTAFGGEVSKNEFRMTEKTGYNICTISRENWQLHVEQAQEAKVITAMDLKVLAELHEKKGE